MRRAWAVILAGALACVLYGGLDSAYAKSDRVVYYGFDQAWSTAVRFLRIDEGYTIVERDAEAGYVLFEVKEENKVFQGALEVVRTKDDRDRPALRLILRIEDRPSYMERGVLNRLERKLRDEHGAPKKRAPPPKPKPDSSGDDNKSDTSG